MRSYAFLLLLVTLGFRTLAVAQPFDPEAATEAYLATVSAEDRERSDAYSEGGYWLQLIGFLYGLGVAWILLATRLSAWMRDWAEKRTGRGFIGSAIYVVQYILVTFVLGFPLAV